MNSGRRGDGAGPRRPPLRAAGTRGQRLRFPRSIGRALGVAILSVLACVAARGAPPASEQSGSQPSTGLDFLRDVYPIFQRHCLHCHGPERQEGALRLDRREFAARRGHTGRPILGGGLRTNSIWQRVTTEDGDLRMPKGKPPLKPQELDTLRRWVEAGTPWGDPLFLPEETSRSTGYAWRWPTWSDWDATRWPPDSFVRLQWWFWRFGVAWIVLLAGIGMCERSRQWVQQQKPWVVPPRGAVWRGLACVNRLHYLAAILALALAAWPVYYQQQAVRADAEIAELRSEIARLEKQLHPGLQPTEKPPRPVDPRHPRRLGGEYYRGNDERDPRLFNGGFYRTCTMRVWLCGSDGTILHWGDVVPDGPCSIRFEIEQSPGAADALFAEDIWNNTFLSPVPPQQPLVDPATEVARFREEGPRRWVAEVPLDLAAAGETPLHGTIYLYRGVPDPGQPVSADPHYAAEYTLRVVDGRIAPDSELWMGYIFRTGNVLPTPEGKIPEDEWFSFRPIPEIEGEQTTSDPRLLGIEDYREELHRVPPQHPGGAPASRRRSTGPHSP